MKAPSRMCLLLTVLLPGALPCVAGYGNYGINVEVLLKRPGCDGGGGADGGQLDVENTNVGVWTKIVWHGYPIEGNSSPNLNFVVTETGKACPDGTCGLNTCPDHEAENCDHTGGDSDPCNECHCEIEDEPGRVFDPGESFSEDRCNMPFGCKRLCNQFTSIICEDDDDCPGEDTCGSAPNCDNGALCNNPGEFCVELAPGPQGQFGLIFEVPQVSFDGTCFMDTSVTLGETLEFDESDIKVTSICDE